MTFDEALEVYFENAEELWPGQTLQPSEQLSYSTKGIWYLYNCNGLLARVGTRCKRVFQ